MQDNLNYIQYSLPENTGTIETILKEETLWCTQKAMAQLFGVGVPAISKHLKNIFEEGELDSSTTVSKMEIVVNRGFRGEVAEEIEFYNLDAILTSTGEQLLQGTGSISHQQAVDKATAEYKKYQQRTLSDVEIAFLDSIDALNQQTHSLKDSSNP